MPLQAGFACVKINPPPDIPSGMWMAQKHVRGKGLHQDLVAMAVVFADNGLSVALIDLDLCFLSDGQAAAIRSKVEEATGIPFANVLPFCSHTHAGPVTLDFYRGEGEDCVASYVAMLPHWVAGAVVAARDRLQPVRVGAGRGRSHIGVNRDLRLPDGRFVVGCNPEGFSDPEVGVLRFDALDGRPVGSIVNYACHPTVLGPENVLISADYPGSVRQVMEQVTGAPCVFLQGASGNMGPVETFVGEPEVAHRLGKSLGLEAARVFVDTRTRPVERRLKDVVASGAPLAAYEEIPIDRPEPRLRFVSESARLPVRERFADVYEKAPELLEQWEKKLAELESSGGDAKSRAVALQQVTRLKLRADRMHRYRAVKELPVETCAIRLGDTAIVAVAGEPYSEIGVAVKESSPFAGSTLFAGYFGGDMMYIPTAEMFQYDSPPMEVDNSPYTAQAQELITQHLSGLLKKIEADG